METIPIIVNNLSLENTKGVIKHGQSSEIGNIGFWLPLWYLQTLHTKDEEKQNENTTQYSLDTTMSKQTQMT
jgi:hypothetical protein